MQALPFRHVLLFLLSAAGLAGCPAGGIIDDDDVADDDDTTAQPCEESMQIGLDTSAIDLFFWQGEPPPEETRSLATTVPPCGELVVVAQPEWLSASVSTEDDSVTVAVVPEELVSGHLSGYVTLLDSDEPDTPWTIEVALSWRLGRAGAVSLDEGDLTLESGDREVIANLDAGTAELDPDTGNVEVDAVFDVESANQAELDAGAPIRVRLEIAAEAWTGELTLPN